MKSRAILRKIFISLFISFVLIVVLLLFLIRSYLLQNEKQSLQNLSLRVRHDLQYVDNKWDTSKYNADPSTPHPQGSSGFTSSLYIITNDGYVIERSHPIGGILDSADFKHLITFQTPQTLQILANEQWRVLSRPIINETGAVLGVSMVAYFNPPPQLLTTIDEKLERNLSYITSSIVAKSEDIDVGTIDVRNVDYDVTFEIVNKYNRVLLNTGRVPTYIDPSYVQEELIKSEGAFEAIDTTAKTNYLLYREKLIDTNNRPIGIIVSGKSTDYITTLINHLLIPALLINLVVSLLMTIFFYRLVFAQHKSGEIEDKTIGVESISFDSKNSVLHINDANIAIPYATNQYELCKAVFSAPTKRWELDELLELFGDAENLNNWRKVYDATLALNKRAGTKIVVYKDKTFRLNPDLTSKLQVS